MSRTDIRLVFTRDDDAIEPLLDACQRALEAHPLAAQAILSALVTEGRHYAESPEGKALLDRLASSELLGRARMVWETLSLTAISASSSEPLPSACIDAVVRAAAIEGLEPLLTKLMLGRDR